VSNVGITAVTINSTKISQENATQFLGGVYDVHLTWCNHI